MLFPRVRFRPLSWYSEFANELKSNGVASVEYSQVPPPYLPPTFRPLIFTVFYTPYTAYNSKPDERQKAFEVIYRLSKLNNGQLHKISSCLFRVLIPADKMMRNGIVTPGVTNNLHLLLTLLWTRVWFAWKGRQELICARLFLRSSITCLYNS